MSSRTIYRFERYVCGCASARSALWMELPCLSTEAADYIKALVERQRIGKYPQITQIKQILFQILCAPSWPPNIREART
jgi:hypothetical protein